MKTHFASVDGLEARVKTGPEDVKKLQRVIAGTSSNVNRIWGSVGGLSKTVQTVNAKLETTTSKLNPVHSRIEKLSDIERRLDALSKFEVVSSGIVETKSNVDEERTVFSHRNYEDVRLASSFSGKTLQSWRVSLARNLNSIHFNGTTTWSIAFSIK